VLILTLISILTIH